MATKKKQAAHAGRAAQKTKKQSAASMSSGRLPKILGALLIALGASALWLLWPQDRPYAALEAELGLLRAVLRGATGMVSYIMPFILCGMGTMVMFVGRKRVCPLRALLITAGAFVFFGLWHIFSAPRIETAMLRNSYREFIKASYQEGIQTGLGAGAVGALTSWHLYRLLGAGWAAFVLALLLAGIALCLSRVSLRDIAAGIASHVHERADGYMAGRQERGKEGAQTRIIDAMGRYGQERAAHAGRGAAMAAAPAYGRAGGARQSERRQGCDAPSSAYPPAGRAHTEMPAPKCDAPPATGPISPTVGAQSFAEPQLRQMKSRSRSDMEQYKRSMQQRMAHSEEDIHMFLDKRKPPVVIKSKGIWPFNAPEPPAEADSTASRMLFKGYDEPCQSEPDAQPYSDTNDGYTDYRPPEPVSEVLDLSDSNWRPPETSRVDALIHDNTPPQPSEADIEMCPLRRGRNYGLDRRKYVPPAVRRICNSSMRDEAGAGPNDFGYDMSAGHERAESAPCPQASAAADFMAVRPEAARAERRPEGRIRAEVINDRVYFSHVPSKREAPHMGSAAAEPVPAVNPAPAAPSKREAPHMGSAAAEPAPDVNPAPAAPQAMYTPVTADLNRSMSDTRKPDGSPAHGVRPAMEEIPEEKPYFYPPIDLLHFSKRNVGSLSERRAKDREKAVKLEQTLQSFGIQAKVVGVSRGPAVTRFEMTPAPGVRVNKIASLADDIALNLAATTVRIEAPIPGKPAVGIELPNDEREMVTIRDVLDSGEAARAQSKLAFALGKDNAGKLVIADIAKMPHVLIAGATGSGKSVCINTIIMSIIYRATPDEVRLILIDPKVVELSVYNGVPHLLVPVVTDPKKAASALNWAVLEMTERYQKFAERGVRDIKGFNRSLRADEKPLPQIVVIIDELSDLMMVAPGEVEDAICRLAQLARAAGIHLVIATQRPSVNVITGVIKANIPSRIAFTVASQVDSRTIIDGAGAEKLLGRGDMLFLPQGVNKPQRVQGANVTDEEVNAVTEFIKSQHEAVYNPDIIEQLEREAQSEAENEEIRDEECDPLLSKAISMAVELGQVSISMLQRRMRIGYARAGRIVDEMTRRGIIGAADGAKPREVLISREEFRRLYADEAGNA